MLNKIILWRKIQYPCFLWVCIAFYQLRLMVPLIPIALQSSGIFIFNKIKRNSAHSSIFLFGASRSSIFMHKVTINIQNNHSSNSKIARLRIKETHRMTYCAKGVNKTEINNKNQKMIFFTEINGTRIQRSKMPWSFFKLLFYMIRNQLNKSMVLNGITKSLSELNTIECYWIKCYWIQCYIDSMLYQIKFQFI